MLNDVDYNQFLISSFVTVIDDNLDDWNLLSLMIISKKNVSVNQTLDRNLCLFYKRIVWLHLVKSTCFWSVNQIHGSNNIVYFKVFLKFSNKYLFWINKDLVRTAPILLPSKPHTTSETVSSGKTQTDLKSNSNCSFMFAFSTFRPLHPYTRICRLLLFLLTYYKEHNTLFNKAWINFHSTEQM